MSTTPRYGLEIPDPDDNISVWRLKYNRSIERLDKHSHVKDVETRLTQLRKKIDEVTAYTNFFKVVPFPSIISMEVSQTVNQGIETKNRDLYEYDPSNTAVSVQDEERCFVYFDTSRKLWTIVEVADGVAEDDPAYTIPGRTFKILVYSIPLNSNTPYTSVPIQKEDDTDDLDISDDDGAESTTTSESSESNSSGSSNSNNSNATPTVSSKDFAGPVFVIGDSLTVGARTHIVDAYKKKNKKITIEATQGDTINDHLGDLESKAAKDAKTWIVALGTNHSSAAEFRRGVNKVLEAANKKPVYWINISRPPKKDWNTAGELNDILDSIDSKNSNFTVIDFREKAINNKDKFQDDGIHLKSEHYDWRAKFYGPEIP